MDEVVPALSCVPEEIGGLTRSRRRTKVTRGRREGMHADTTPMETSVAVHIDALVYIPDFIRRGFSGGERGRLTGLIFCADAGEEDKAEYAY